MLSDMVKRENDKGLFELSPPPPMEVSIKAFMKSNSPIAFLFIHLFIFIKIIQ